MDFTNYTAETDRLLLRTHTDDDFDDFFDLHRRADVAEYLPWYPRDEEAARQALRRHQELEIDVDDQGNRMTNLTLTFDIAFPDDEGGQAAYDVLPRAVQQSHDRLCTVSRTVEVGTPIEAVTT